VQVVLQPLEVLLLQVVLLKKRKKKKNQLLKKRKNLMRIWDSVRMFFSQKLF
jgi:hypothetical protein